MQNRSILLRVFFGKEAVFPKNSRRVPEQHPNKTLRSIDFTRFTDVLKAIKTYFYNKTIVHFENNKKHHYIYFTQHRT